MKVSVFILCLAVEAIAVSSAALGGQTFVINAGFEVNTWEQNAFPTEWWTWPVGTAVYYIPDPNKAHSGNAYVTQTAGPDGWANIGPTSKIRVAYDTNYTIGAFVADANGGQGGLNPSGTAALRLDWYANPGDSYDLRLGSSSVNLAVPKDGNYYYFSGVVRNTLDANYAQIILAANRVSGQSPVFKFDDIVFAKANPPAKPDFNADRSVNFADFAMLAAGYKQGISSYDMDGDGSFGISDLALFTTDWARTIPDLPGYQFVWSDEFDGTEIDFTNWTYYVAPGYNDELEYYTDRPDNSLVEDGRLVIIAREEQYDASHSHTSAMLNSRTKADFRYGRMAARIKIPVGQGMWPAFWMMPTYETYGNWPDCGEIDIMEAINQMVTIHGTMHFTNALHQHLASGGDYSPGGCFADDYHVYAIEWEPNIIRWFVDDVMYFSENEWSSGTYPYPAPFDDTFHFILCVAVGGSWAGPPDQTTVFPQRMLVDWVRVYQKNP